MPKYTRMYTRTGDDGTTGLVGGQRVPKESRRIEAFGTLDELSSVIGIARIELGKIAGPAASRIDAWLAWVQDLLFNLGSEIATLPNDRWENMPELKAGDVAALERAIDEAQNVTEPLANFIHPGGSAAGGFLHFARTVCRRGERILIPLMRDGEISPVAFQWVNRLSDALFVWARRINAEQQQPEALWNAKTTPPAE